MNTINEQQYNSLVERIYNTLISNTNDLGDITNCHEEAEYIVKEWCNKESIEIDF
jgi:hypothetical protein